MRYEELFESSKKFVGTCVNSFDEMDCVVPQLPYDSVTEFSQYEENAEEISKEKFVENVAMPTSLTIGEEDIFLLDRQNNVFMLYKPDEDVHYLFV